MKKQVLLSLGFIVCITVVVFCGCADRGDAEVSELMPFESSDTVSAAESIEESSTDPSELSESSMEELMEEQLLEFDVSDKFKLEGIMGRCNTYKTPVFSNLLSDGKPLPDILFEYSVENGAWGYIYSGFVICSDRSVYSFEKPRIFSSGGLKGQKESIFSNARLHENIKVSEEDFKKMLEYSAYIDAANQSEERPVWNDAGLLGVFAYDYTIDDRIALVARGDWEWENTGPHTDALICLIGKYTSKAYEESLPIEFSTKKSSEALELYDKLPIYVDFSEFSFGVWKYYEKENCIIRATNGKLDAISAGVDNENLFGNSNTEHPDIAKLTVNVYTVDDDILIVEIGGDNARLGKLRYIIISKAHIVNSKYDYKYFTFIDTFYSLNTGETNMIKQIKSFPVKEMAISELLDKLRNKDLSGL